jgi:hypothetical protein
MATAVTVPDHAWAWLQRSRDVVQEIAARLTGAGPAPGFMDELRPQFAQDQFVRDVVIGVVVDVAFNGRVPLRRPAGTSWDRGLTWWAAACAGITPAEFDRRSKGEPPPQPRLFGGEAERAATGASAGRVVPSVARRTAQGDPPRLVDRAQIVHALRQLLAHEQDGQIPAAAVRALLGQLDPGFGAEGGAQSR